MPVNGSDDGVTRSGDSFDLCFSSHDEPHIGEEPAAEQFGHRNDDDVVFQRNRNDRQLEGCPF